MSIKYLAFFLFLIAGLLHVVFFLFESVFFSKLAYRFGIKKNDIDAVKIWAFNQGFYNLFLAIAMFIGLSFVFGENRMVAGVLVGYSGLSMIGAGVALWFSATHMRRAALIQLLPPLFGFVFLYFHVFGS